MFYIVFLSLCSFNFLLRLDLDLSPSFIRTELNSDAIFFTAILYFVNTKTLLILLLPYLVGVVVYRKANLKGR